MGLSDAFPWQCAAMLMFLATLLSAIATGLPAWSTTISEPAGTNQFTEYGPWETCQTDLNQESPIRRCTQELVKSDATCGGSYLAMRVLTPIATVFAFLSMICFCVLLKKASVPIAAVAIYLGLIAMGAMIASFAIWITIAEDGDCNNRQGSIGNYRASFMMMVSAAAFALGALCISCFGVLWLLKSKKYQKLEIDEEYEVIEYVQQPIQSYPAYSQAPGAPTWVLPYASGGYPSAATSYIAPQPMAMPNPLMPTPANFPPPPAYDPMSAYVTYI